MKGKESGKGSPSNRSDDEKSSHTASAGMETITPFTGNKKWDTMYHHLVTYKRNHNNCLVPNRYKQMPQLGNWVSTQRRYYKLKQAGNDTPLCQLRIDLLTKIGFVWATKDPRHVPWEQRFNELLDYKKEHGHCLVPMNYKENPQLANWVSTQRQEWKLFKDNRQTRLNEEKASLLNDIGFVWEAQCGDRKRKSCDTSCKSNTFTIDLSVQKQLNPIPIQQDYYKSNVGKAKASLCEKENNPPWIAMFKEYLWQLDQNLSPEDTSSLKLWADEQRLKYQQQRVQRIQGSVQSGNSNLTLDQFKLLNSIKFNWNLENSDGEEKCPSAESKTNHDKKHDLSAYVNKTPTANLGMKNCSDGACSVVVKKMKYAEVDVHVAETLYSMGAKNRLK